MTRPILICGGAGFIGSHFCKMAASRGYLPVTYDSLSNGHRDAVRWGPLEVGDIRDSARLDQVFARHRPLAVAHFAGLIEVGDSVRNPDLYHQVNVEGSRCLLAAMARHGVRDILFSSTCAVYGAPRSLPLDESHPRSPANPYGATKLAVETLLEEQAAAGHLRPMILRYFNAAGADPDGELGERHHPETHLIPLALRAATGLSPALPLYGADYPTPDGTCVRDYVHVHDLARAHLAALDRLLGGGAPLTANLGTGRGCSVREVLSAVERVTGRAVPVAEDRRRPGDLPMLVADPSLAARELGWRAELSDLPTMVEHAWGWMRAARIDIGDKIQYVGAEGAGPDSSTGRK
jgi:UDP-arabinose 4-epimerase